MKPSNFIPKQIALLQGLGFKPTYPDKVEPNYCLYRLDISSHPLLTNLHLIIDGKTIDVWCQEDEKGISAPGYDCLVVCRPFEVRELFKILAYLN